MKQNKRKTMISASTLITGAVLAVTFAAGCGRERPEASESIEQIQKREGIPVRVTAVSPDTLRAVEVASGTAEGYIQTTITAGMVGRISEIKVRVGDNVEKDASLMTIDPDIPQNYTLAKTQYENAAKTRDRVAALAQQGGVSQEMLDQVEAGYLAAKEGLQAVRKSQFVHAPFAGTVVNVSAEPNGTVDFGKHLVALARIDRIRVPLFVSQTSINRYAVGQRAFAIVGGDTIPGAIEKVSMAGQSVGHNFQVDAVFSNTRRLLKPGMFVTVRVVVSSKPDVLALPMETVISEGRDKYVFTIVNDTARKTPVSVGIRGGDRYEIISGIGSGDRIVSAGSGNLADGAKVKVVE